MARLVQGPGDVSSACTTSFRGRRPPQPQREPGPRAETTPTPATPHERREGQCRSRGFARPWPSRPSRRPRRPDGPPARASAPHTVLPGETLWSIAAAYNFTTRTIAAYNGLSEDASVYAGETIQIPTEAEGAAALASAGVGSTASSSSARPHPLVTPGESLWSIAAANGLSVETLAAPTDSAPTRCS